MFKEFNQKAHIVIILVLIMFLLLSCSDNPVENTDPEVQTVEFVTVDSAEPDTIRTLQSLKREGDLYIMTYYGDYRERLEALNDKVVKYGIGSIIPPSGAQHECSIFSALGNPERPILGRNLDNYTQRLVLVGLYNPPDGYASIAMTNLSNMGFHPGDDLTQLSVEERTNLLNSVFFACDGMNERGVSVALASVDAEMIIRDENKKLVNISYLQREILDFAGNLDEAIAIVENRDVFDQDVNTLSHHILIADASGRSAIAEYRDGQWRIMRNDTSWQVVTNIRLYGVPEDSRRTSCNRYNNGASHLENANGNVSWEGGMDVLEVMSVGDTQWSSVYDLVNQQVYISLYRKYNLIQTASL